MAVAVASLDSELMKHTTTVLSLIGGHTITEVCYLPLLRRLQAE